MTRGIDEQSRKNASRDPVGTPRLVWCRLIVTFVVVTAIGGCGGVLLISAVRDARLSAQRTSCKCQLKQIGLALYNYREAYGSFPPAYVASADGRPMHSWRVLILPYIDQQSLYDDYDFNEPWDGPKNIRLLSRRPQLFDCPSRDDPPGNATTIAASFGLLACTSRPIRPGVTTSYAAVFGPNCVFRGSDPVSTEEITDGPSDTAMIGELTKAQIPWTKPEDIDIRQHPRLGDPLGFSSSGRNGRTYFLRADGSVWSHNSTAPQATVDGLFTRNGNEPLGEN